MDLKPRYAFVDVDKTIYDGYTTPDFLKYLNTEGIVKDDFIQQYLELDFKLLNKFISYNDIADESTNLFAKGIAGMSVAEMQKFEEKFYTSQGRLFLWVPKVFEFLEEKGFKIILVSATVLPILDTLARHFNIHKFFGSELEIKDGKFTGKVISVVNYKKKAKLIMDEIKKLSIETFKVGFGDSVGDIPMLSIMDISFLINPKDEILLEEAKKHKWNITVNPEEIIKIIQDKI